MNKFSLQTKINEPPPIHYIKKLKNMLIKLKGKKCALATNMLNFSWNGYVKQNLQFNLYTKEWHLKHHGFFFLLYRRGLNTRPLEGRRDSNVSWATTYRHNMIKNIINSHTQISLLWSDLNLQRNYMMA